MIKVLLFVDMEFPRGRGTQVEKSWKFQGLGGVPWAPWNRKSCKVEDQTGSAPSEWAPKF